MPNHLPATYDAQLAKMAEQLASTERLGADRSLSTAGGILSFSKKPMPGNQVAAIILDSIFENTYYTGKYDPNGPVESPKCYALSHEEEGLGPHPTMQADLAYFEPQSSDCHTCPHNEWGSSDRGRGKACQQRRRLAMIPAGRYTQAANGGWDLSLFNDQATLKGADIISLKLPVTSVKAWSKYVHMLATELQLPPMAVVTRISLVNDVKTQFRTEFDMVERVPPEMLELMFQRNKEASENIIQPYSAPSAEDYQPPHGGGLR